MGHQCLEERTILVSLQQLQVQQSIGAGEQKWQEDGPGCQQLKHLTDVGNPHRQQEREALPDEDSVILFIIISIIAQFTLLL